MSDRYIQIQSFSKGLDTRRSKLLEEPGALVQLTNAHINAGGEAEQRLSFAKDAVSLTASTFGLEATASGLVVFGSAVNPGALPASISYRRCDHPTGYKVGGLAVAMVNILSSCNFNGSAFVVARFSDGNVFCYYGDVSPMPLVGQIKQYGSALYIAGGVEGVSELAVDLKTLLNTITSFTATSNVDENGTTVTGDAILLTATGIHAGFTPSVVSAAGTLSAKLLDQNSDGTVNVSAIAGFYITGGAGGNTIEVTAPANSNGTGTANLTGGTIAWAGSIPATVSAVVAAINSRSATTGYGASIGVGHTDRVVVSAPVAWGALSNPFVLTVNLVGITTATASVPLSVTVTPNPLVVRSNVVSIASAVVAGLTGTGSYVWSMINTNGPNNDGFTFSQGGPTCSFSVNTLNHGISASLMTFQLDLTDLSTNVKATTTFTVQVI